MEKGGRLLQDGHFLILGFCDGLFYVTRAWVATLIVLARASAQERCDGKLRLYIQIGLKSASRSTTKSNWKNRRNWPLEQQETNNGASSKDSSININTDQHLRLVLKGLWLSKPSSIFICNPHRHTTKVA